jgi:hypothetical protein
MRAGRDQVITLRHHGRSTAGFSPMRQAGKPKLTLATEGLLKPPVDAINDQRCVLPHPANESSRPLRDHRTGFYASPNQKARTRRAF